MFLQFDGEEKLPSIDMVIDFKSMKIEKSEKSEDKLK